MGRLFIIPTMFPLPNIVLMLHSLSHHKPDLESMYVCMCMEMSLSLLFRCVPS